MIKSSQTKIVDCTIRDGGLVNNWDFSVEFVQNLYAGLNEAGVDYMEIGYKNSPKLLKGADQAGPWRFWMMNSFEKLFPIKVKPSCPRWSISAGWMRMIFCRARRACWISSALHVTSKTWIKRSRWFRPSMIAVTRRR